MPTATTSVRGLPVAPSHSPLRTRSARRAGRGGAGRGRDARKYLSRPLTQHQLESLPSTRRAGTAAQWPALPTHP